MRKIRVLHLIKSLNRGGAETLLAEGLRFADRERFELSYAFFNREMDALASTLAAGGTTVTCFGGRDHLSMLARARRVALHLRDQRIDLLHCHLPMSAVVGRLAARTAGVPVVYTEHNKPEWYRWPTFWLNAWTYGLQRRVIAVSGSVEDSIRTYVHPTVPVTVIRNGIDASHFQPSAADGGAAVRARLGIAAGASVVGTVAALIPQKRLHDWIEAARLVHERRADTRFLIVGEGPQERELSQRIAARSLQGVVHLCGVHADVRPFLAAMDIYMMSSAYEGLPVALLEAMAMECAPVCTAVGGIPEVIRDGCNGFLTRPAQPGALAERVVALQADPLTRRAVAAAAHDTVLAEFGIARMIRAVEETYLDVLGVGRSDAVARDYPPAKIATTPSSRS